jgi:hypothetical protein
MPTDVAKFKLRALGCMGIVKHASAFARSNDSGKPRDSLPNTKKSPSWNFSVQYTLEAFVVK